MGLTYADMVTYVLRYSWEKGIVIIFRSNLFKLKIREEEEGVFDLFVV